MENVVIDTNVLLDGQSDDHSFANKIIDEVLAGRLAAWSNQSTWRENNLIINQQIGDQEYKAKLVNYLGKVRQVENMELEAVADDAEDNKILASAVAAGARHLITSDWHLLKMEEYKGVKIVSPQQFWNWYQEEVLGLSDWAKFVRDFFKND